MSEPQPGQAGSWQYLLLWRADGSIDAGATIARHLPVSDTDAALLVSRERPGELHYAVQSGTWHIWDGRCHRPDLSDKAGRLVMDFALRAQYAISQLYSQVARDVAVRQPADAAEGVVRKAIDDAWKPAGPAVKYAAGLMKAAGSAALLRVLATTCGVPDEAMAEREPWLLNCSNGTVDLRTGVVRPHDVRDMLTHCLDTAYDPGAQCPGFWSVLCRMVDNDPAVAEYVLRVLGYCLIGGNPKQLVWFIDGPTNSGKSLVMHVVRSVLGDLAHESQTALITLVRHGRNARVENSIRGRRLVTITETSSFMTIDEGQLKRITGEPVISVDQHYSKTEIRTPVTWSIVIITNKMPSLVNFDDAMRRRVVVVPGGQTIPDGEIVEGLGDRLIATESAGILAMLVRACAEVQRTGLTPPLAVHLKTAEYVSEQDTVSAFAAECCVLMPYPLGGVTYAVSNQEAWQAYQNWSSGSGRLGRNEFFAHFGSVPGVIRNRDKRCFEGVILQPQVYSNGHGPVRDEGI